jgi:signal peptidase I
MKLERSIFEALKEKPFFKGQIVSGSMIPVIHIGESIVVDVGNMDIKRFDIVVIYTNGILICHYVWNINKIVTPVLLQTRNMARQTDYPVPMEDYLGKVVSHKISFWRKLRLLF